MPPTPFDLRQYFGLKLEISCPVCAPWSPLTPPLPLVRPLCTHSSKDEKEMGGNVELHIKGIYSKN